MSFIYFDCQNGISGDMTLGALIDAGAPLDVLSRELKRLPVRGWSLEVEEPLRQGIRCTLAKVILGKSAHHTHRHFSDIRAMLESASLPGQAAKRALKAFALLAKAEAAVHKIPVEQVHFHEVGAVDAIIDITGSMIALETLGADRFGASTVVTGFGEVRCGHGLLPVPAPATARLLEGAPIEAGPVEKEMTTPTGAAILMSLNPEFGPIPPMRLEKTAYGAGSRIIEGRSNCLRVLMGEPLSSGRGAPLQARSLCFLTTEIDDMNPEFYGPLLERLFDAGCLDAHLAPVYMKKGRPGVSVRVLAEEAQRGAMIEILLRHSSTFGVRAQTVDRYCLERKFIRVETPYGPVRVKQGLWEGAVMKAAPEFEDCRQLAEKARVAVGEVYQSALAALSRHGSAIVEDSKKSSKRMAKTPMPRKGRS